MVTKEIIKAVISSQINVTTQRGFIPVDERMRVIDGNGKLVSGVFFHIAYFLPKVIYF